VLSALGVVLSALGDHQELFAIVGLKEGMY
jgi:hypothetical protein